MDRLSHDIVVVGGGAAGLRAAIAALEENPKLSVAIVSKVYPMRSHTVSAEGGLAAVLRDYDNFDMHSFDTIKGSDYLADQAAVEFFVRQAPSEVIFLEHLGCPWSRDPDGRISARAFGGMSVKRTIYAADKTGFHLLHTLFQTTLRYDNMHRYDEWFATRLVVEDGRVDGLVAINLKTGEVNAIEAKSVILATGGAGRIYQFTTNAFIKTGDGMALAYRAGVPLKDLEFVQYHPTALPGTGILMTEASRGEGGHLINRENERFLKRYTPEKLELGPRDVLSRSIMMEIKEGRAFEGPYGSYVLLDLRHLGSDVIDEKLPFVRELASKYAGIDPVHEPIPVRPAVHYCMGGIDTSVDGRTLIHGLYAAGEAASVSINGANRLGSNSLTECLVFGAAAGRGAADYSAKHRSSNAKGTLRQAAVDEENRIFDKILKRETGHERLSNLRVELQTVMENNVGIFRSEQGLVEAAHTIRELRGRFNQLVIEDKDRTFNTDLTGALELDFMLDVAEAIAVSALSRLESRGAHYRLDYAKRDDAKFLKHTLAYCTDQGVRLDYSPVNITRWSPTERVY